jgi:superfamily II DNA/RNA helicase
MKTFDQLGVPRELTDVLARNGVTAPFPIQEATVTDALAGRDLCGRAPTGSGKTLAFSVPMAATVGKGKPRRPRGLILVPTRELASQVMEALRPLGQSRGRTVAAFYGGTPIGKDRGRLDRGVDVMVACPGRLADLVQRGAVDLRDVDYVVIDEADRMADMGFLPEVRRLLDQTSSQRQTLLFSATLDGDVDVLITRYQRNPARHEHVADEADKGDVRHLFWRAEPHDRLLVTRDIVTTMASPAIVFTRTKHGADRLARQLQREGVTAAAIHGNRTQNQRERALADFTSGRVGTLVATDVAARGIHVDAVGVVVHFDPPATDKDYVHRSGRTGRAGADGVVVSLVVPDKLKDVKGIQRALDMPQGTGPVALADLGGSGKVLVGAAAGATSRTDSTPREERGGAAPRHRSGGRQGTGRGGNGARGSGRGAGGRGGSHRSRQGGHRPSRQGS